MHLEDNICPICLYIYIEPVTMPCEHELCLTCFKQNVEEANFCCPMCRTRISTWARRAARNKTLVNEKRWNDIKKNFPHQVQKRIEGEEEDDEEMKALNVSIKLAEPGEIRNEFEEQLRKLREQRAEEKRKEQEASERLIQQLQEEEERVRRERAELQQQDEAMARELSETIKTNLDQRTRSARSFVTDSRSNSGCMEPFLLPQGGDISPYPYPCLTPISSGAGKLCVDKEKVEALEEKFRRQKVLRDKNLITTQDVAQLEEQFRLTRSQADPHSEGLEIDCLPRVCDVKSALPTVLSMSSLTSLTQNEVLKQMSENLDTPMNLLGPDIGSSPVFMVPSDVHEEDSKSSTVSCITVSSVSSKNSQGDSCKDVQRSTSAQNVDSITQELNHFRPIRSCPLTPPRRLPSGKLVEPQLIRTTPRNLNSLDLNSPHEASLSDIDAASPIMKRRLSELAEERKDQVKRHSKYTATLGDVGSPARHNSDNENRNPDGASETVRGLGRAQTSSVRSVDLKDISNSPLQLRAGDLLHTDCNETENRKRMILPLEPMLLEEDAILAHPRDIAKCKKENECFVRKGSVLGKQNHKLSRSKRRNNSGHVRYSVSDSPSPQQSVMKWIKKGQPAMPVNSSSGKITNSQSTSQDVTAEDVSLEVLCRVKDTEPETSQSHSNGDSSVSKSGRHRKLRRYDDFVYGECVSPKKSCKRKLVTAGSETKDGYCSDMGSEGSDDFVELSPVKQRPKPQKTEVGSGAKCKHSEVIRRKTGLKTVNKKLKSSKMPDKSNSGTSKTMHDFFRQKDKKDDDVEDVTYFGLTQQEREDRKLAQELQKQFEMEAKLKMSFLRVKGTPDEYSFRNKRSKRTVVDV